jgi:hypothetical protein
VRCSPKQWVAGRVDAHAALTVLLLARVIPYSNQVQQPRRATAILASRPHTRQAARFDHEQDRAGSYGSEGRDPDMRQALTTKDDHNGTRQGSIPADALAA